MTDIYTKLVEVHSGDTIVHADGERWVVTSDLGHILVEEGTIIEATGPIVEKPDLKKIRIQVKKKRWFKR